VRLAKNDFSSVFGSVLQILNNWSELIVSRINSELEVKKNTLTFDPIMLEDEL